MKPTHYPTMHWYLEQRDASSNTAKFYNVMVTETGVCVLRWGRIGTAGQSKTTPYPTHEQALVEGRKQVYAKLHKGYVQQYGDLIFSASVDAINRARQGNPSLLWAESQQSFDTGAMEGSKDAGLKHYRDFLEQAKDVTAKAAGDPEHPLERLEELERVWAEIEDLHDQARTAMDLAKATIYSKVFA